MLPIEITWSFLVMEKYNLKERISGKWENKVRTMMNEGKANQEKLEASWLFNYGSLSWDKCVFPFLKSQLQPYFSQDGNPFEKDDIKAAQLSPQGTSIIQNLNSVLIEEQQWKFPHEFNPENSLNHQGEFVSQCFIFTIGRHTWLIERNVPWRGFLPHCVATPLRMFTLIWPTDAGQRGHHLSLLILLLKVAIFHLHRKDIYLDLQNKWLIHNFAAFNVQYSHYPLKKTCSEMSPPSGRNCVLHLTKLQFLLHCGCEEQTDSGICCL